LRFLADVGGVLEVFTVVFAIFLYPISKFTFIYEATKVFEDKKCKDIHK